jgi:hypothetical protein
MKKHVRSGCGGGVQVGMEEDQKLKQNKSGRCWLEINAAKAAHQAGDGIAGIGAVASRVYGGAA